MESVKAASEVYTPVGGTVTEVNDELTENDDFGLVNRSPQDEGWFAKLRINDPSELDTLLTEVGVWQRLSAGVALFGFISFWWLWIRLCVSNCVCVWR